MMSRLLLSWTFLSSACSLVDSRWVFSRSNCTCNCVQQVKRKLKLCSRSNYTCNCVQQFKRKLKLYSAGQTAPAIVFSKSNWTWNCLQQVNLHLQLCSGRRSNWTCSSVQQVKLNLQLSLITYSAKYLFYTKPIQLNIWIRSRIQSFSLPCLKFFIIFWFTTDEWLIGKKSAGTSVLCLKDPVEK